MRRVVKAAALAAGATGGQHQCSCDGSEEEEDP
uniref:Methylmalonyl CoA epimerase n=1 Tax=Mus musculus TaxID=10090 RepID=A0A0U1RNJ6_MOUSE